METDSRRPWRMQGWMGGPCRSFVVAMMGMFCYLDVQVFEFCAPTFGPSRRFSGHLSTGVESATAIAHRRNVYVMGGSDVTGCDVTYVQCYDVDSGTCAIVSRMPSPARLVCALPYRNYAILLGKTKAFVLNFDDVSPYPDDTRRVLLRNLLQQQKSVSNHAKMQLQQNAQQTWLQVTQTMLFQLLKALLLMSVRKS